MTWDHPRVCYIVTRSRHGWAVNVDADFLSAHPTVESARAQARLLTRRAHEEGRPAEFIDLSDEGLDERAGPPPPTDAP